MTTDRIVADVIAVAERLRADFGGRKIFLFGESGGTVTGVLAAQRRPDLFAAWFGSGQMVDPLETDRGIRADLIAHLRETGDDAALSTLEDFGRPPYRSIGAYGWIAGYYDALAGEYTPPAAYTARHDAADVGLLGLGAPEYTLTEQSGALRGLIDGFAVIYPRWQRMDFRRSVPELAMPVHLFTGAHELRARRRPALAWLKLLRAPRKQLHDFSDAGHAAAFEHVEALHRALRNEAARARP